MKKFLTLFAALLLLGSMTVVQATDYYVAGTMNGWNTTSNDNKMSLVSGTVYSKTFSAMPATSYEFKISTYNWESGDWGSGKIDNTQSNISLSGDGNIWFEITTECDVTFYFDEDGDKKIYVVALPTSASYAYTVVGGNATLFGNTWNPAKTENDMALQSDGITYKKTYSNVHLAAGDILYKVAADHNWSKTCEYPFSGNYTLNIPDEDDYDVTFTYVPSIPSLTAEATSLTPPAAQSVDFDDLAALILKGTEVTFAATSTGITNPAYAYYVKPNGGSYGSAVSTYTFDVTGDFVVKVVAEGDNTTEPVAKEKNVTVYATHTFTSGQKLYVDFTAMIEGEKGVNYPSADAANANAYDANGAGTFKTVTFTADVTWSTLQDFIKTEKGGWDPGLKFIVPADGQNWIKVSADGASYTWDTYVDLTTDFYLAGSFNNWSTTADRFMKATGDATEATVTINIAEYSNITFKVIDNGAWRGCDPVKAIDKDDRTVAILSDAEGHNVQMTPYAAGDYIFTLDLNTRELTVTYPDGDAMPIPQNIYLACDVLNNWAEADPDYKFSVSGNIATLDVTLAEETNYAFKLVYNAAWLGANYNFKYYWCTDVPMIADETQANLYSFKAGTYTFNYNIQTGKLSIIFQATSATDVVISEYEYATLYSATAFDVPAEVEAYVITDIDGIKLAMERIYRIPANTGVLLHAPQGTYQFYEGDGRWMDEPASNLLKGTTTNETIDNALVHYILTLNDENKVGLFWPYGTGATYGVGAFENNAGKAYLEIPAASQPASVVARRGFLLGPGANMPTGIDNIQESTNNSQKQIINGQLFIFRDGHMFNAQGVRVQ